MPHAVLEPDGTLRGTSPMNAEQIIEALRLMLLSRAIDELAIKLQRLGQVGVYSPVHGQEAAVIGPAMALDPSPDWMIPASREQPPRLQHGRPREEPPAIYLARIPYHRTPAGLTPPPHP